VRSQVKKTSKRLGLDQSLIAIAFISNPENVPDVADMFVVRQDLKLKYGIDASASNVEYVTERVHGRSIRYFNRDGITSSEPETNDVQQHLPFQEPEEDRVATARAILVEARDRVELALSKLAEAA
jgi:hypothetical protein